MEPQLPAALAAVVVSIGLAGCASHVAIEPSDGDPVNGPDECSHARCTAAAGGEPHVCCNDRCVALRSSDCDVVLGDTNEDRAIVLGYVGLRFEAPPSLPGGIYKIDEAMALAHSETDAVDEHGRPRILLGCTMASWPGDPEEDTRVMDHLVDSCVQAAYVDDWYCDRSGCQRALQSYLSVVNPNEVALIVPRIDPDLAAAGAFESLWAVSNQHADTKSLPWTTADDVVALAMLPTHLPSLSAQPRVRATTVVAAEPPVSLASSSALATVLERYLVLNGTDASTNEASGHYRRLTWTQDGAAAGELAAFAPHLVFVVTENWEGAWGTDISSGSIIAQIEAAWTSPTPRPIYAVPVLADSVVAEVSQDAELAGRLIAAQVVWQAPDPAIHDAFFERWIAYTGLDPELLLWPAPERFYDAAYLLGAAAASIGDEERPTGAAIRERLRRMNPPGARFAAGPDDFPDLVAALRSGADVDLEGASGPLTHPPDVQFWCVSAESPPSYQTAGLLYRGATGEMVGELTACP